MEARHTAIGGIARPHRAARCEIAADTDRVSCDGQARVSVRPAVDELFAPWRPPVVCTCGRSAAAALSAEKPGAAALARAEDGQEGWAAV